MLFKPEDYVQDAVEVARNELQKRQIPETYIAAVFEKLMAAEQLALKKKTKQHAPATMLNSDVLDAPIPGHEQRLAISKRMSRRIAILICAISVPLLLAALWEWSWSYVIYPWFDDTIMYKLLTSLVMGVGGLLLYRLKKAGWYILVIYFGLSIVNIGYLLFIGIFKPNPYYHNKYDSVLFTAAICLLMGLGYLLLKPEVKTALKINSKDTYIAIGIPVSFLLLVIFLQ
ncbi:MAG TPA: hypothetical protein PKL06_01025 [Chitinophagales bacterium]|nr:hypothetical protein [Chitinophagales bacterium]